MAEGTELVAEFSARTAHDPKVTGGRPLVRGMGVTAGAIVGRFATGRSLEDVLAADPGRTQSGR